jgi:hypothetical protein
MSTASSNRVVVYLQSQHSWNLIPSCSANLTAINISSFHFGFSNDPVPVPYIHLNDNLPGDPMFGALWKNMQGAQENGVLMIAMLGGAGGAYTTLFGPGNYDTFYPILVSTLKEYNFNGVDLDVEESVSLANMQQLISDLRRDFPTNFYITSAPVCSSLIEGQDPFAGINWADLKADIDWFNVQFYSGFGTLESTDDYNAIIKAGYAPQQILGGALTNSSNGSGYVEIATVCATLSALNQKYAGQLGGTMGWEFFNANDISENINPIGWCKVMKAAVG